MANKIPCFLAWNDEPLVKVPDVGYERLHETRENGKHLRWPVFGELIEVDGTWVRVYAPWVLSALVNHLPAKICGRAPIMCGVRSPGAT